MRDTFYYCLGVAGVTAGIILYNRLLETDRSILAGAILITAGVVTIIYSYL